MTPEKMAEKCLAEIEALNDLVKIRGNAVEVLQQENEKLRAVAEAAKDWYLSSDKDEDFKNKQKTWEALAAWRK